MSNRLSALIPVLMMLLLVALTYFLDRWVQPAPPPQDGKNRHDPDYFIDNFEALRYNPDGSLRYRLTASRLTHYPDTDSADLTTTRLISYSRNSGPVTLTGDQAHTTAQGKRVDMTGHVEVTRPSNTRQGTLYVRTQALTIYPDDQTATTRAPVVIDTDHLHLTGTGMDFDQANHILKLHANVRARYVKQ